MANRWITQEETQWLYENCFTVRSSWISPQEGYEFRLSYIGEGKVLAYRTTLRGCYNAALKIKAAEHRVHLTGLESPQKCTTEKLCPIHNVWHAAPPRK